MTLYADDSMDRFLDGILANMRIGEFEEAVFLTREAVRFGTTIAESSYSQWRSKALRYLYWYMPCTSPSTSTEAESLLSIKSDSFGVSLVATIARCFEALESRKDQLEAKLVLYTVSTATLRQWIDFCDECIAERETSLAARVCLLAIRSISAHTSDVSTLDDSHKQMLLDLWFRRSHIFELQERISESIAAIQVYARLFEAFQLERARKPETKFQATLEDPLAFRAKQTLAAKRRHRLISR